MNVLANFDADSRTATMAKDFHSVRSGCRLKQDIVSASTFDLRHEKLPVAVVILF
ncbi:MAG: hypothetical protein RJA81_2147 [Planctomycetota bacterium]|jgi:hypothetical protein